MSLEEGDDYLSDKFLTEPTVNQPKTYAQRRKEAARLSSLKQEQNRKKTRRQLEQESRAEGLSKSLFEAQDASSSKALSMMLKMGFKPGQSLGKPTDNVEQSAAASSQHKTDPVPINEWEGKKGIGSLKRALSPETTERLAKMAKMAEAPSHQDFRDRARQEYEERRAEGRLGPAQLTCRTLDEKEGKEFGVLWLNPANPETFPTDLLDALSLHSIDGGSLSKKTELSLNDRLRRQIEQDKLQPLGSEDEEELIDKKTAEEPSPELIEEVVQFLRLRAQDRLQLVLSYLRNHHAYCFWCGVHYNDTQDMDSQCPGETEEDHD